MFVDINNDPKLWWQYAETWVYVMFSHQWPLGKIYQGFILLLISSYVDLVVKSQCCTFRRHRSSTNRKSSSSWICFYMIQCTPDISRSCISLKWIYLGRMLDPIFWRPRARHFSRNRRNTLDPIRRRQFFAKSAHHNSLCSRFTGDNFSRNQL